jgi:hypothetical protein
MGSPIDLATSEEVAAWLSSNQASASPTLVSDPNLASCITAWSALFLRLTGRGDQNTDTPEESPFVQQVNYTETYDGNGSPQLFLRNWPINSVASLVIYNQTIPVSTGYGTFGYVIAGDGKRIVLQGGYGPVAAVSFYQLARLTQGGCGGPTFGSGSPFDLQNVFVTYNAGFSVVPPEVNLTAIQVCARNYKRRNWIDQRSQAMAQGAGTITYRDWDLTREDWRTIREFQARAA